VVVVHGTDSEFEVMKAIDPSVKTQVIELFQAKKETQCLSQNKGSVEPQLKSQSSTLELKASGIITRIPLNKDASSPSSSIGEGKAAIPTTEITHNKTPRDGGPLSHLLPSQPEESQQYRGLHILPKFEVCNDEPPIDFSDIPYPDPYPNPNIDHDATINQNVPQQDDTTEEEGLEQSQVKPPLRMPQDQSKSESDLEPEEEPLLIPDCDPDESHETILWKRIMAEKDQHQREYRIIQRRQLSRLQDRERELEIRESKLVEYEQSVKELKAYGITSEVLRQYLNMVEEKVIAETPRQQ